MVILEHNELFLGLFLLIWWVLEKTSKRRINPGFRTQGSETSACKKKTANLCVTYHIAECQKACTFNIRLKNAFAFPLQSTARVVAHSLKLCVFIHVPQQDNPKMNLNQYNESRLYRLEPLCFQMRSHILQWFWYQRDVLWAQRETALMAACFHLHHPAEFLLSISIKGSMKGPRF